MSSMARSTAARLAAYLATCQPFDWAARNCCQFAAGWVQRMEGRAPAIPSVRDLAHSRRVLADMGGTLLAAVTAELARQPVAPAAARPGDVVLLQRVDGQTLGICAGRTAAVLTTDGVAHIPMQAATAAWHIEAAACATA